ncbi:MAG: hypothetical protein AAFU79_16955 [Myxococcota bacterium]
MVATILFATSGGVVVGWVARTLFAEPQGPQRERHLIDAYGQGWRACEAYLSRRGDAETTPLKPAEET